MVRKKSRKERGIIETQKHTCWICSSPQGGKYCSCKRIVDHYREGNVVLQSIHQKVLSQRDDYKKQLEKMIERTANCPSMSLRKELSEEGVLFSKTIFDEFKKQLDELKREKEEEKKEKEEDDKEKEEIERVRKILLEIVDDVAEVTPMKKVLNLCDLMDYKEARSIYDIFNQRWTSNRRTNTKVQMLFTIIKMIEKKEGEGEGEEEEEGEEVKEDLLWSMVLQ
jgi:hypothetical protein